jgi:hypothetical protein
VQSENTITGGGENAGQEQSPFSAAQILEVIASAWPEKEVDFHRLFLFDRLQRGDHDWNFLIVTRRQEGDRLELAAVAFELDEGGNVSTRLESRKASIPSVRLLEVIEGLLLRFDEAACDYRDFDLTGLYSQESPAEFLGELTGIPSGVSDETDEDTVDMQPGDGDRQ